MSDRKESSSFKRGDEMNDEVKSKHKFKVLSSAQTGVTTDYFKGKLLTL